jgi:hypothetical protein
LDDRKQDVSVRCWKRVIREGRISNKLKRNAYGKKILEILKKKKNTINMTDIYIYMPHTVEIT